MYLPFLPLPALADYSKTSQSSFFFLFTFLAFPFPCYSKTSPSSIFVFIACYSCLSLANSSTTYPACFHFPTYPLFYLSCPFFHLYFYCISFTFLLLFIHLLFRCLVSLLFIFLFLFRRLLWVI